MTYLTLTSPLNGEDKRILFFCFLERSFKKEVKTWNNMRGLEKKREPI